MTSGAYEQNTGAPAVLWAIAASPRPVTTREIAEILGSEQSSVSSTCTRLWRSGYVLRRSSNYRTEVEGRSPYEYVVATLEDSVDVDGFDGDVPDGGGPDFGD